MSNSTMCIICDCKDSHPLYPGVIQCSNCGYIYADLNMSQAEFEKLYNSGYFKGEEYLDYVADKEIAQINFMHRLKVLMKFVDSTKHNKLLEVGSAYGFFLECASRFFKYVRGIDVTAEGIDYTNNVLKLKAYKADLETWDFEGQKFDITCMWDTIEHLRRPDIYIKKIAEHTPTGGLLAITTGDIGSCVAKFRKNKWRLIHPPTHAHYFTKESMTKLLNRYGYSVVHFEHCGFYRSVDLMAYNILVLRWKIPWLYKIAKFFKLTSWKIYFNLNDIMYVIARRN